MDEGAVQLGRPTRALASQARLSAHTGCRCPAFRPPVAEVRCFGEINPLVDVTRFNLTEALCDYDEPVRSPPALAGACRVGVQRLPGARR